VDTSPLQQQLQKARSVAANISQWCGAKQLDDLGSVFSAYAEGQAITTENLLDQVAPLLCTEWFPAHSSLAFGHLLRLLEKGPVEYHRVILLMLRALVQYTPMESARIPQVYAAVSQLVESPLCVEAVSVLEAVLQSSSMHSEAPPTGSYQENGLTNNVPRSSRRIEGSPQRVLGPQSSLKLRNSSATGQQLWTGSAGQVPSGTVSPVAADILPSREKALRNTQLALGRVLDTYGPGRKRDYKRLVPFVTSTLTGSGKNEL